MNNVDKQKLKKSNHIFIQSNDPRFNYSFHKEDLIKETEKHPEIINIAQYDYGFIRKPGDDKRLPEFVKYIRTKLPKSSIRVYTNGDFLTIEKYLKLKYAGVDIFEITQHSETPSATGRRVAPDPLPWRSRPWCGASACREDRYLQAGFYSRRP